MLGVKAFTAAQPLARRTPVRSWAAPRLSARLISCQSSKHEQQQSPVQQIGAASALSLLALAAGLGAAPAHAQVLDAAQVHLLADILRPTFTLFTFLYIVRIPMTWYPNIDGTAFPWSLAYTPTEPILSATRKVVPLVGGVDITPIVWVGLLSFFNEILLGPQGLLVLIERQGGL